MKKNKMEISYFSQEYDQFEKIFLDILSKISYSCLMNIPEKYKDPKILWKNFFPLLPCIGILK